VSRRVPRPHLLPRATSITVAPITQSSLSGRPDGQWGMPPLSAYTPFESLLFFQSLATRDPRPASFAAISDLLRNNPFVRQDAAFDTERLRPEALQELYTTLMREGIEEARSHASPGPDQNGHNPDSSPGPNPKKRKLSSPTAEGLFDAAAHATVVPKLVSRLYARYKERVTREIRNEERRYREIRDEIERLQREEYTREPGPSAVPEAPSKAPEVPQGPVQTGPPAPDAMDLDVKAEEKPSQHPAVDISKPPEAQLEGPGGKQATVEHGEKVDMPQQPAQAAGRPQAQEPHHYPPAEAAGAQQGPPAHPKQEPGAVPYLATGPQHQPSPVNNNAPPLPSQQPGHGYRVPSPSKNAAGVPTIVPASQPTTQPPSGAAGAFGLDPNATARPAVVPPPQQGVSLPAGSPVQSAVPTGDAAGRRGSSMIGSPMVPQYPMGQQPFQQWSPHRTPQPPYPQHISPYANAPYPTQPIPERHVPSPHVPHVPPHPDVPRTFPSPYPPPGPVTPGPIPAASQSPYSSVQGSVTPGLARQTPSFSASLGKRPPLPPIDTSGSLTPWKRSPRMSSRSPGSPVRPRPEDVSPISERAPSPIDALQVSPQAGQARRKLRDAEGEKPRARRKRSVPPTYVEDAPGLDARTEKSTSSARTRRDCSTTSTRSRGRSVASREDDSLTDSGSVTHRRIKHEMPSTPAGITEDAEPEARASSRRRGTTAAAQVEEGPVKGRLKRKRGASESFEVDSSQPEPGRIDTTRYVLCTRNFPRTGAPIMNDVTAHKHASIFAKPLTERDAPGYRDLIYRPQDLKSIKSAIHQGSKAVAAATEAASTPAGDGESPVPSAGTPSKNTVLLLPKTADLIPPKAIVNSAQLEKELIRMFANAIMFNPTPERGFGPAFPLSRDGKSRESTQLSEPEEGGIIHDTREMCEDVEQAVTRWRAAERTADELGYKSILTLRRGSASDTNADSADENKG